MSIAGGAHALQIGLGLLVIVGCGGTLPVDVRPPDGQPAPAVRSPEGTSVGTGAPGSQATVTGRLVTDDGRPLLNGVVILRNIDADAPAPLPPEDVTIRPDGTFEFRNVPRGRYELRARGETEPNGTSLFATFRIVVDGRDLHNLNMPLVPGATLSGMVIVEQHRAADLPDFRGVRVRAPLADGSTLGEAMSGHVGHRGVFAIRGLVEGHHVIRLEGLPEPWVLKSVTLRGRDITDAGLEVEPGQQITNVRVTVTDVAAEVSGTVRDGEGEPAPGALVVLAPLSPQFWMRTSRRLGLIRADEAGRYRIRGLPAGEYRVIASAELDEAEALRRDLLQQVMTIGVPLSLGELEVRVLDLALTRIEAGATLPREAGS